MIQIPSISDAFRTVTAATEAALIADTSIDWGVLPKKVYFMHGHRVEIVTVLQEYTDDPDWKNKKYPLVILHRDINRQKLVLGQDGYDLVFTCQFFIVTLTEPHYRAEERQTRNFTPILHPILAEFVNQIRTSEKFGQPTVNDMSIEYTDRYRWGADVVDKNILNDHIDAVDVETITLRLYNQPCNFSSNF